MSQPFIPIAIIGEGAVMPGALGTEMFFDNLLRARCFIREVPPWLWPRQVFHSDDRNAPNKSYSTIGAMVEDPPFDPGAYWIPPVTARLLSRAQKFALHAAGAALADAGWPAGRSSGENAGVFVAAIGGGEISEAMIRSVDDDLILSRLETIAESRGAGHLLRTLREEYERKHPRLLVSADAMTGSAANIVAGRIASVFDLRGPSFVLDAACASSLAALDCAVNALHSGRCDFALAGGVETWMDVHAFVQFSKVTALSAAGCHPFDDRADGFVLGEGCGMVLLQRLEDAVRERRRILAVIRGIGSSSDGADSTGVTAPTTPGQVRAMQRAYAAASSDPADLAYLECHGTGTRLGDATELESVRALLQSGSSRGGRSLPIASVKAAVGHTRTAAGMAGLFSAMMTLRHRLVPPQVNFEHPTRVFPWDGCGFHVPVNVEPVTLANPIAGISGFGFGGINYHVVIEAPPAPGAGQEGTVKHARARPRPASDVALLFPGQGSHYVGMLRTLRNAPGAQRFIEEADAIVKSLTGSRLSDIIEPMLTSDHPTPEQVRRLQSTEMAQPAILLVSAILLEWVREQGVDASMAIGHSLGEYTALYAAGAISFADAIHAVTRRGQFMAASGDGTSGSMAYVFAPKPAVETLRHDIGPGLCLANLNSYEQFVVAGPTDEVNRFVDKARSAGWRSDLLPVDRAFHSPMVADAVPPLRELLRTLPIHAPRMLIPANISGQWYPFRKPGDTSPLQAAERDAMIELMCAQLDHPVDFTSQMESAYATGLRRFVEVGPRTVLSGMVSDILQGKPFQVVALDQQADPSPAVIRRLKETLGRPLDTPRRPPAHAKPPNLLPPGPTTTNVEGLSVHDRIRAIVADVSGYDPGVIGDDVRFDRDLGIDSLKMIAIVSRLRGSILPAGYRGFRELTTINRIAALGPADPVAPAPPSSFRCYRAVERMTPAPPAARNATEKFVCRVGSTASLCHDVIPGLLQRIQAFSAGLGARGTRPLFRVVSHGPDPRAAGPWFRSLRAFMLSVARELPDITFTYHHVDDERQDPAWLRDEQAGAGIGIRWDRDSGSRAIELVPLEEIPADPSGITQLLRSDDVVLVSGGARGIASACVRSLVHKTEALFLLIGQQPAPEAWFEQEAPGRIRYVAADLADPASLARAGLSDHEPTLILHAAGLSPVIPLAGKTADEVRRVMDVKALGLENLLQAVRHNRLRGIISFSSIVAHFGNLAQQDYAAANGFLDGWSAGDGVPHLSIGWTAWGGIGMASRGVVKDILGTSGIDLLPPAEGVAWFERILAWWLGGPRDPSTTIEVFGGLGAALEVTPAPAELPSHVACLTTGGSAVPLFGLCGIFGHAYRLQLVARELRSDFPFYALEPPAMDWSSVGCASLEAVAAFYADTIEAIRPSGPVALLGTSFGGNVTFEVSRQLQSRGREIQALALVDAMPPDEDPQEHDHLAENIEQMLKVESDQAERDGARVASAHLEFLRAHQPNGLFKGSIHYFLMTGGGWPGLTDRRFRWNALALEGIRLWLLPGLHGAFAHADVRPHLADGLAAMMADPASGDFLTLDRYTREHAALRRESRWFMSSLVGAGHERWPTRRQNGEGRLEEVVRYRNRVWLRGWARDAASGNPPRSVAIFLGDTLVHFARVDKVRPEQNGASSGFHAIVDIYGLNLTGGERFDVMGIGTRGAWRVGSFIWKKDGPHVVRY